MVDKFVFIPPREEPHDDKNSSLLYIFLVLVKPLALQPCNVLQNSYSEKKGIFLGIKNGERSASTPHHWVQPDKT